jgi:hypothetical protein
MLVWADMRFSTVNCVLVVLAIYVEFRSSLLWLSAAKARIIVVSSNNETRFKLLLSLMYFKFYFNSIKIFSKF